MSAADLTSLRSQHRFLSQISLPSPPPLRRNFATDFAAPSPFPKEYLSSQFPPHPPPAPPPPPPPTSSSSSSSLASTLFSPLSSLSTLSSTSAPSSAPSSRSNAFSSTPPTPPPARRYSSRTSKSVDRNTPKEEPKQSRFLPARSKEKQAEMDLIMFNQVAEITECLYLCAAAAVSRAKVRSLEVTHIINCTLDVPNFKAENVVCVNIQVDDSSRAHLGIYFDRCADMIRDASLKDGKVLVHCVAGVSRSASLCIAYLMKYERMNLLQAYKFVKRKRSVIHPNVGFWRQLIEYEKRIFGRATVKMVNSNIGMVPEIYIDEEKEILRQQKYSRYR